MSKKIRIALAVIILAVSISLLIWGYSPNPREMRIREIYPTEMQLPTPSSLHFDLEPAA
ncbi:MAG: hypothetical protein HND47_17555 [Chloroflexi bacterium]|nr:hypothetical protein [Chloroflexota bacterium]